MSEPDQDVAKRVLEALANKGFVKINSLSERRVAKLLSKRNIGAVVRSAGSTICDFPEEFKEVRWGIGLVPSSQAMRLPIFRAFKYNLQNASEG
jgi:hypothetical protein